MFKQVKYYIQCFFLDCSDFISSDFPKIKWRFLELFTHK